MALSGQIGHRCAFGGSWQNPLPQITTGRLIDRVECRIFTADEDKTAFGHNRTSVARYAELRRQLDIRQRWILPEFRPIAKGFGPHNLRVVQVQGRQLGIRRICQRYAAGKYGIHIKDIAAPIRIYFSCAWIRGRPIRLNNPRQVRKVGGLDIENASFRIESSPAPVRAADDPGPHNGAFVGRGRKNGPKSVLFHFSLGGSFQFWRSVERVVECYSLRSKRRRKRRKRLSGSGVFTFHVAVWNGPLFDRPYRLAGNAIEYKCHTLFRELN